MYRDSGSTPQRNLAKPEQNPLKYLLSTLFLVVILVFTFYFIFRDTSLDDVRATLKTADWRWLLGGFLLMLFHVWCSAEMIRLQIIRVLGVIPPRHVCLNAGFIGFYFNNVTPSASGGQPMQIYYLYRCHVDVAGTSILFLASTLFYNSSLILLGTLMLFLQAPVIVPYLYGMKYILIYGYVVNGFLLFLCLGLIYFPRHIHHLSRRLLHFAGRHHLVHKMHQKEGKMDAFFARYRISSHRLREDKPLLLLLSGLSFLQMTSLYFIPYFAARSVGEGQGAFWHSYGISAVLQLAAAGFPTPGAVGVTESGFMAMYQGIFAAKLPAIMLLTRMLNLYAMMLLSALVTLLAFRFAASHKNRMRAIVYSGKASTLEEQEGRIEGTITFADTASPSAQALPPDSPPQPPSDPPQPESELQS